MILKVYQKYLIKEFLLISGKITFIFLILALIMGLLEELNFFSDFDVEYFYPILIRCLHLFHFGSTTHDYMQDHGRYALISRLVFD